MSPLALAAAPAATPGGALLVLTLVIPVAGAVIAALVGGRRSPAVTLALVPIGLLLATAVARDVLGSGAACVYHVGGWAPPLGIALRADGLAAAMLLTTAVIVGATAIFARRSFSSQPGEGSGGVGEGGSGGAESRRAYVFWPLLLGVWGGVNAIVLSNDLFSLFVAMELLSFAAVPLVSLDGSARTLAAALRYLLFALVGSMLYLLGTGLLYGVHGTLDIGLLAQRFAQGGASPACTLAVALMTIGLLAKAALFPLHTWLPPAHAGAPPAASAVLSALVVKGAVIVALRLWFDVAPELLATVGAQVVAGLGAGAILVGSVLALRQERLKLLVAYSTVAQIGYLFLAFGLVGQDGVDGVARGFDLGTAVVTGATLQMISHACAKAAMFMAAGSITAALGHDRLSGLGGAARAMPISVAALAIGGLSLLGVPPSGGFRAKWILLTASIESGRWWWALVVLAGGMLAGGYLYRALAPALAPGDVPACARPRISRLAESMALMLALVSLLLGLAALTATDLIEIGRGPQVAAQPDEGEPGDGT